VLLLCCHRPKITLIRKIMRLQRLIPLWMPSWWKTMKEGRSKKKDDSRDAKWRKKFKDIQKNERYVTEVHEKAHHVYKGLSKTSLLRQKLKKRKLFKPPLGLLCLQSIYLSHLKKKSLKQNQKYLHKTSKKDYTKPRIRPEKKFRETFPTSRSQEVVERL